MGTRGFWEHRTDNGRRPHGSCRSLAHSPSQAPQGKRPTGPALRTAPPKSLNALGPGARPGNPLGCPPRTLAPQVRASSPWTRVRIVVPVS